MKVFSSKNTFPTLFCYPWTIHRFWITGICWCLFVKLLNDNTVLIFFEIKKYIMHNHIPRMQLLLGTNEQCRWSHSSFASTGQQLSVIVFLYSFISWAYDASIRSLFIYLFVTSIQLMSSHFPQCSYILNFSARYVEANSFQCLLTESAISSNFKVSYLHLIATGFALF